MIEHSLTSVVQNMSSSMVKFTKEQDEILVESVAKHPPIYNPQSKDYKDLNIRDAIWKDISCNVGRSDEDCKRRYKNIKDAYLKNKRARIMNTGASASSKPSKWHLAPFLSFLDTIPQERKEDSNVGVGGGGGAGAFTRWLREFRRETYKVNSAGGASGGGGGGGGTYHSTAAEDGRRRHSFNAHDKSAHHRADQRLQLQGGGSHVSPTSKTQACRRANSTAAPKSRTRNDGSFAKANCSAVATIRELPSSKENRSSHGNNGVKSGRVTTRMTETCDGHIPRHRAPLPPVDVKDAVCGHEKFPSCPVTTATVTTVKSNGMSVTAARKSWAEEQTGSSGISSSNSYPKEQPPPIVRPYPKRLSNGLYTQQLKTVMERCEKGKPELLDRVRSMRTKSGGGGYVERLQQTAEKHFCVPLSTTALSDLTDPKSQLTQAQLEKYSRAYDDLPHRETDEYSSCFDGSDSALSSHLTKEELEHYTRIYEEKSTSQISLTEKTVPSHQHQTSYAQSEGYHSYVSSTDSTSTPFLDRLRRDSESAVVVVNSKDSEKPSVTQGRDSSASSGSSSETLKWHGSNSDLSTVSSGGHHRATTQLIAHSSKVSAPQRHHSESVMSVTDGWSGVSVQEHRVGNQRNIRKLFPVSTYTVQPAMVVDEKTSPKSPPALTVAERINELEKQQQQQQQQQQQLQQTPNKFTYFDPEKKHRVADHSLRAIQKRALLSFYERHQPGSSWRSEPQLSPPPPRPPPIPCRPRLPTPLSRRSSISSEYDSPATWNDDCSKDDSSAEEASNANPKELSKNNPLRSSSCGSLSTAILGPMVLGPSISIDDWVPELPPKKKQVARQQTPQAKREPSPDLPPPPPVVDDDEQMFISDEPLPPPPPEAIWPKPESLRNDKFLRNGKEKRLESSFSAVEDVLLSRDFNASCGGVSAGLFSNNNYHMHGHQHQNQHNAMSEKSKSLSYIYDSHKAVPQTPVKSFAIELLQPPLLPAPPPPPPLLTTDEKSLQFPHNGLKEFGRSSSVRRNKLTIPNKDYCKSEFSARKSVFQGAGGSAVPKQQVVMSTVKPPAFSATISTVQTNVVKHQICTPLKIAKDTDKKTAAATNRSPSAAKSPVVVGPLKSSGVFPPSLEPSCPPTLYQQSQSKASYLSAYKREPREREKGLPNFEGSYKRTASPNSGGRGDAAAVVEPQDVENVAPDGSDCCSNLLDSSGGRLQSLQLDHHHHLHHYNNNNNSNNNNNNNTATSQQQSSPGKQQIVDAVAVAVAPPSPPPPAVLSERPVIDQPSQQQQLSKTLPRANNSTGQDFKRSSRTPRTQSDPSNMPNKADAAITTLQLMMMPPPRHSESTSSLHLQKRSQSDLSQVGSTESGYSSLSLNAPSPSHSPTRLSSGDFGIGGPPPPLQIHSPSATTAATAGDLDECCTSTWHTAEPAVAVTDSDHRYRNPVSRSCSVVSSDSTSQTELKSVAGGTPLAVRRKSPEEIECEELSRDLISHLSPSDKLHNILEKKDKAPGPDVKRSTDYVSPLFRMDLVPRSRTSVAEKLIDCSSSDAMCGPITSTTSTSSTTTAAAGLSANSSYYTTSEPKAKLLNLQHYSRQIQPPAECNGIGNLQKKKADLVSRLDRKLKVLRDEQIALAEEAALNETLGVSVAERVKSVAKPQEANKFKTHVQEVGHITSLLLSLSGRLARAENALLDLDADHLEKKALEEKKCKLTGQLEEAKELKENIDRRGDFVSTILCRYLTADEYSDYDHFIAMKAKLLIDAREIADKIQLGEEQLRALKETLED